MYTLFLRNKIRIVLFLVGLFGAIVAPPWVPLLVMGLLAIRYPAWEAILIGLLVDLLWLAPSAGGGSAFGGSEWVLSLPLFTLAGLALVWALGPLRQEFLLT